MKVIIRNNSTWEWNKWLELSIVEWELGVKGKKVCHWKSKEWKWKLFRLRIFIFLASYIHPGSVLFDFTFEILFQTHFSISYYNKDSQMGLL